MSPAFTIRQLVATEEQKKSLAGLESITGLKAAEEALAKAFADDLFTATVNGKKEAGGDTTYVGPFWTTTVLCGLLGGEVYVAETADEEKKIVGCAVWFPPKHSMYDTKEEQDFVLGPLMSSFSPELQECESPGVKHASWHLQTIGVDPAYQRKGAARQFIDTVHRKAAAQGESLVTECAKEINVRVDNALHFDLVLSKAKVGVVEKPTTHDYQDTFVGVNGYLEFPMWVLRRGPKDYFSCQCSRCQSA
ncbi:hypothetical protein BDZ89DRAFT_1078864 [Hymenopellis radicata]|nr:hypothetical protein BDZ89DRAFT_1078864 [Hymenopellis radicata]